MTAKKIKPVMAWAVVFAESPHLRIDRLFETRKDGNACRDTGFIPSDWKVVRVRITPVTPTRKVKR